MQSKKVFRLLAAAVVLLHENLAEVNADAHVGKIWLLLARGTHGGLHGQRKTDAVGGHRENRETGIPRPQDLARVALFQLFAHDAPVELYEARGLGISQIALELRRVHEIRKQDRQQLPLMLGEELLHRRHRLRRQGNNIVRLISHSNRNFSASVANYLPVVVGTNRSSSANQFVMTRKDATLSCSPVFSIIKNRSSPGAKS